MKPQGHTEPDRKRDDPGKAAMAGRMTKQPLSLAIAAVLATLSGQAWAQGVETRSVNAMNDLWGKHENARPVHTKGVVLEGTFAPTAEAAALSMSRMFEAATPVRVRFSDFTGRPDMGDASPEAIPHGIGIAFMPDGRRETDVMGNTLDAFPAATTKDFLELLQALKAGASEPTRPNAADRYLAAHPAAAAALASGRTPTSFARQAYNGLNAFVMTTRDGRRQAFRWRFEPVDGIELMSGTDIAESEPNVLMDEIARRIGHGPVEIRAIAVLADPGDQTTDPSQAWPPGRRRVLLGTITLHRMVEDQDLASRSMQLLPTRLAPGIEPSDDPMLGERTRAYDVAQGRRD